MRLIEIEIKSWFELARFLNRFIARFFSCPWPQLTVKHSLFSSSVLLLHVNTRYNLFAHSSCTSLFILLCIKSSVYCFAHFILLHILLFIFSSSFYFLPIFTYILFFFFFALSIDRTWPEYISLLIISCIIEYVTNLEPWTSRSMLSEPIRMQRA